MRHFVSLILTVMLPLVGCGGGLLSGEVPLEAASLRASGKGKKEPKADPPSRPKLRTKPLTNSEARQLARQLGFKEVSDAPFKSHGQLVFKSRTKYITPDFDGHTGGTWKVYDIKGNRLGTFNDDLTQRIKK
ncbi:toxin C-terminal domain-containing protein [Stigmatella sp. ncwal1]|uniref:Toxin C-terminal domain-containing protein n=1 Tax=Stigmatella ashevillensis TaxID=2995309 RepID=A0ABT5DF28_9BACT|nr:toxin C-terminal domain-containing protein [Stigmatella ashevillena]MDC0711770.1 toxin C-terminal domain-containing protein [Stigmatella ashevillena]